jgi:hypothetical protein
MGHGTLALEMGRVGERLIFGTTISGITKHGKRQSAERQSVGKDNSQKYHVCEKRQTPEKDEAWKVSNF